MFGAQLFFADIIWQLTDLLETTIPLFLFGNSYSAHYTKYTGQVVCVFSPSISNANDSISLSVNQATQIVALGYSDDIFYNRNLFGCSFSNSIYRNLPSHQKRW